MLPSVKAGRLSMVRQALAVVAADGLSDPADQPKFQVYAPNALHPSFKFRPKGRGYNVVIREAQQMTGLVDPDGNPVATPIWGYGYDDGRGVTWPGRTFEVKSASAGGRPETRVSWYNQLGKSHLLPVDTNLHWAYSLNGYDGYSIEQQGVPIITHLHGGHTDFQFDGNPEFFYSPGSEITGPQWDDVPGGFTVNFRYDNDVPAGTLWYHDHALGITRLNVYAGLAGFYIVRDEFDTGRANNTLGLPAFPYELAYAIQDRMFYDDGRLFYPAFPGDPFYSEFIETPLPEDDFPGGGPTALAEFFGDQMVVNGKIWPKTDVEPRNYRMRLLNGTDSRFLAIQFFEVPTGADDFTTATGPLDLTVVGSDQGLASEPTTVDTLLIEPGSRYDVVFDFAPHEGKRIIMKNIGGDEPFGGDIPGPQGFPWTNEVFTDRIMAFDVVLPFDFTTPDVSPVGMDYSAFGPKIDPSTRTRKVALFEGTDEYGRLQPLLGTAEPATDFEGEPINWPDTPAYSSVGLVGQMEGSIAWHSPTTENPALDATEEWEVWNMTGDAHPIHLHLVNFEILETGARQEINFDSNADEDGFIPDGVTPADDGVYLVPQPIVQHNGAVGNGFRIVHPTDPNDAYGADVARPPQYVENAPKDMVTALPGQITRIRATFDKPGRYVWHCHILSHEDHEMMRVLHVGEGANPEPAAMQTVQGAGSNAGLHTIKPAGGAQ
jgi:FtsP/CotA-like multicopper oxidase with cupredoxin domain